MATRINWTLQQFKLDELTDYYKNPRSLSEKEFKQLKTSLDKFGMIDKPIVNLDAAHTIIGGHQRKRILETEGAQEIECWVPDRELSEKEVEELNIRLNKNTGSWDFDTLANSFELDDLLEWGFERNELDLDLWADDPPEDVEPQLDKAEELREKWGVESGQLWQLGEHRLVCGDCTDKAVVEKVMQGERADCVLTDPPYGMNLDTDFSGMVGIGAGNKYDAVIGDNSQYDPSHIFRDFGYCKEIFLWGADYYAELIPNRIAGSWIVWDKMGGGNGVNDDYDKMFGSNFELCWSKEKHKRAIARVLWKGIFGLNKEPEHKRFHPTQKPVDLSIWILEKFTKEQEIIVDLFLGAASLLLACERLGRKCRAVEISPAYVAVAIQRWVDVTGGEPVLLDT